MKKQILFIHGGGDDGYGSDRIMMESLRKELGDDYEITYPRMPEDDLPDFGWIKQMKQDISKLDDGLIIVAHSLGASLLLKYLSEHPVTKKIAAVFLLAPPFWSGKEDWVQGFILQDDFAGKLPSDFPISLYQCLDDDVVPYDHFTTYRQKLSAVEFHEIESGGHQFEGAMDQIAQAIRKL